MHDINTLVATNGAQVGVAVSNWFFSQQVDESGRSARHPRHQRRRNQRAVKNWNITDILKQIAADLQSGKGLAGTILQNQEVATKCRPSPPICPSPRSNLNRPGFGAFSGRTNRRPPTTSPHPSRKIKPMNPLWPIRILFLGLCIGGRLCHQPGATELHRPQVSLGHDHRFRFRRIAIAIDEMLKGFSLRAFSATTFGLLLGWLVRCSWTFRPV